MKIIRKGGNKCELDLLEVYAYPNSQLTTVARASDLKAKRFTKEDGDLETMWWQNQFVVANLVASPKACLAISECGQFAKFRVLRAAMLT